MLGTQRGAGKTGLHTLMGKTEQKQEKKDDHNASRQVLQRHEPRGDPVAGELLAGSGTRVPDRASQGGGPGLRPAGWAADVGGAMRQVCECGSPSARASGDSPGQRPTGGAGCSTSVRLFRRVFSAVHAFPSWTEVPLPLEKAPRGTCVASLPPPTTLLVQPPK